VESLDLGPFNRIPAVLRPMMRHFGVQWEQFHLIPIESGRGCPYGCEFCTVDGIFRRLDPFSVQSERGGRNAAIEGCAARQHRGKVAVFFVRRQFRHQCEAHEIAACGTIIAAGAQLAWVAQISAKLLRDEELVDLIAESGGKWIFIGMESLDPANLANVNKSFNKPNEYRPVLERLARRHVYAITSFYLWAG